MTILGIIQLSTEVIACITSVALFRYLYMRGWALWVPYLVYTCIVEIYGAWTYENEPTVNNLWIYNPYVIVSIAFYSWFLVHISNLGKNTRKTITIAAVLFVLITGAWYFAWGDPTTLISYVLNTGSLVICLCCLLFFFTQIKNPNNHLSLLKVPGFWIATGLLIFYAGISLYTAIYEFLARSQISIWGTNIQNLIPQVLSLILYTTVTVGFIKCRSPQVT
jgi:hypothetical protein